MNTKAKAMVLASFAGDALSMGVHWIYNTNVIDKKWGRVEEYFKPERPTYHPTKDRGEFTHYGDQTLVLLESIADSSGFNLNHFAEKWQEFFKTYDGYFDGATKKTIENFAAGNNITDVGSDSDDLAGAARIAPIAYCYYLKDQEKFINSSRSQTSLTHNNQGVIESAEFFARVVWKVLQDVTPTTAIEQVLEENFNTDPFAKWIRDGLKSINKDTRQAMLDFGQMCEIEAAFPCTIHLIAKYEDNLREGLIENAMAGGDSAGRGLLVGLILGAHLGPDAIPQKWLTDLKAYQEIQDLLDDIDRKVTA